MSRSSSSAKGSYVDKGRTRHEVFSVLCATVALLLALGLGSEAFEATHNWVGPVGERITSSMISAFGVASWLLPLELGLASVRLFRGRRSVLGNASVASTVVLLLVGATMAHVVMYAYRGPGLDRAGGVIGEITGEVLRSLIGVVGTLLVVGATLVITLLLRTQVSLVVLARRTGSAIDWVVRRLRSAGRALADAWREAKAMERKNGPADEATLPGWSEESAEITLPDAFPSERQAQVSVGHRGRGRSAEPKIVAPRTTSPDPLQAPRQDAVSGPVSSVADSFELPPTSLFAEPEHAPVTLDTETLRANAARLVEKLAAYGVRGRVDEIHPGPVVTMYEFEPQSGTKVSKIAGLADDLAMALAAQKVRIVAPIPGKARVGFELPNEHRQTVYIREILEDRRWHRLRAALPMALGKDIGGQPVYCDLSKMPHLLVAGATGAGKSVGLNVMLASLLAKTTPEQVRMLMIDPKVVELAVFDGIPQMLLPVVVDMKKAARALRWAVDEMERRYQLFADAGARNITSYNERVDRVLRGDLDLEKFAPGRLDTHRAQAELSFEEPDQGPGALPTRLPYVVVVVDEFADLMMVAAKDVEACIARLAQKARAAGIHVILATQRPSVDVITGMIKANFPARIGFKVSQREDSKTILGRNGAEHLLGMGDMLFLPPGTSDLERVHCAYISEEEVRSVCDFLRAQGKPVYDEDILKPREDEEDEGAEKLSRSDDPLYDRAVEVVAEAGYCSISHIQRQLSVGYNKAAKLVERMERDGIVGPAVGKAGGRREVLVSAH